ncbi:uncharacterized protein N7483_011802 [Penicillium malachiteum]|uniref:uncharacterized protein n=1 Tax=Penicillium malachiteum TaxID=1324776 RepID=UPI00254891F6|nr:uncharacterized protein N7483_011802 [Penicillium malachiteum]KAJ5714621.1 hypothetical protein N7483_011802 [Penicillium malachiteum]
MGAAGGVFLRFCGLAIRVLQFLDSAVILAIFSYYLAIASKHNQTTDKWVHAVEGLSGVACLYSLLGALFVCCIGGVAFFAFLGVILDVIFTGVMIAIAVMTRNGSGSCNGTVNTPIGKGDSNTESPSNLKYGTACKLEKVTFAVSIIGIFFFLISILFQVLLARHHKREKRFGPSPANGYTSGSRKWFWNRNKSNPETNGDNALPGHPTPADVEYGTETKNEKRWFGGWGRNKNTAPTGTAAGAENTYGYGNSAYTGNY